jgi:hypothetical protein
MSDKKKHHYSEIRVRTNEDLRNRFIEKAGKYQASKTAARLIRLYVEGKIDIKS